jgi:hypothetical protein
MKPVLRLSLPVPVTRDATLSWSFAIGFSSYKTGCIFIEDTKKSEGHGFYHHRLSCSVAIRVLLE